MSPAFDRAMLEALTTSEDIRHLQTQRARLVADLAATEDRIAMTKASAILMAEDKSAEQRQPRATLTVPAELRAEELTQRQQLAILDADIAAAERGYRLAIHTIDYLAAVAGQKEEHHA